MPFARTLRKLLQYWFIVTKWFLDCEACEVQEILFSCLVQDFFANQPVSLRLSSDVNSQLWVIRDVRAAHEVARSLSTLGSAHQVTSKKIILTVNCDYFSWGFSLGFSSQRYCMRVILAYFFALAPCYWQFVRAVFFWFGGRWFVRKAACLFRFLGKHIQNFFVFFRTAGSDGWQRRPEWILLLPAPPFFSPYSSSSIVEGSSRVVIGY